MASVPSDRYWAVLGAVAIATAGCWLSPVAASTLEDLRQLENLINATGTQTVVSMDCPPDHAGYYENDGQTVDRLVICQKMVDLADVEAVWEVMAHESTHIMQACRGSHVIEDAQMPRTVRQLQAFAPHYAKLIGESYPTDEQRFETEAFWMELQPPARVIGLFRLHCGKFLTGPSPRATVGVPRAGGAR
ncbi:MAG: hypothetical protein ACK55H_01990 [Cyanobacteriota bacterium]|jgi:hypothetical protein